VGQTTQTPLDQVEALLAQQRLAQEQLGQALKAARIEQESGYLSSAASLHGLQWSSTVVIMMAVLMCAAIAAVVVAKVVRPKLKTLRELRDVERAKQEELFVQMSLHGEEAVGGQTAASRPQKTDSDARSRNPTAAQFSASNYPAPQDTRDFASEPTQAAQEIEIDFDLDLSSPSEPPESELPPGTLPFAQSALEAPFLVAPPAFEAPVQPERYGNMSDEVKKVQQSLAEKRLTRQVHLVPLQTASAAQVAHDITQPLLLQSLPPEQALSAPELVDTPTQTAPPPDGSAMPSLEMGVITDAPYNTKEAKEAKEAKQVEVASWLAAESQPAPLMASVDPRWQTQLDLAKEFCSIGQFQEAALLYAELVAHADPDVAEHADALLSALPQSR
jgi:hypothetical protein